MDLLNQSQVRVRIMRRNVNGLQTMVTVKPLTVCSGNAPSHARPVDLREYVETGTFCVTLGLVWVSVRRTLQEWTGHVQKLAKNVKAVTNIQIVRTMLRTVIVITMLTLVNVH